jgi:ribose transport system ATP-binding protein
VRVEDTRIEQKATTDDILARPTAKARSDLVVEAAVKRYGATVALDGAEFRAASGEVHGLLGENGAGKSTLIKILSGAVAPDAGRIELFGQEVHFRRPADAQRAGVRTVFQELSLVPDLTVAENLAFSATGASTRLLRRRRRLRRHAVKVLEGLGIEGIDPDAFASDLSLAHRQRVEIAKAVTTEPRVLILDEATSALAVTEVVWLTELARRLAAQGAVVLFISHRLAEVRAACSCATILRNGSTVGTYDLAGVADDLIIQQMLGRKIERLFPDRELRAGDTVVLETKGFGPVNGSGGANIQLHSGEILGVGGLQGQGQAGFLLALYGAVRSKGELSIEGRQRRFQSPAQALAAGIALVPEDRATQGLLLNKSIKENISLGILHRVSRYGLMQRQTEADVARKAIGSLSIRASSPRQLAGELSGGNQQKVLLAKMMATDARVLLLYDPTRGVDIGTKAEIFETMDGLSKRGFSILFFSSDADELIHLCDRVAVLSNGSVVETLATAGLTGERLLRAAVGGQAT